jgi:TRAP transporter TAXI family solute receptor
MKYSIPSARFGLVLSALLLGSIGACRPAARVPAVPTVLRLTSGTPGAGFHPLGEGLARAFTRSAPDIRLEVAESPGAVRNVQAIQEGAADLGFAFADVAYMAYTGRLEPSDRPSDRLRGVAVLQVTPLHLVARSGAGIRSIADLRGRRVGIGPPGSGTALTSNIVLRAFGIDARELTAVLISFSDVADALARGTLDAAFVNGGYPAESIASATQAGADLLPVEGPPIRRLRADYPFLRPTFIPADTYPNQRGRVFTIGVDNLLLCRADLPEDVVYAFTRRFFEVLPDLSMDRISLRMMDVDQAPATPIPLHAGAARYYREVELSR